MSEDDFTGGDVVVAVYHQKRLVRLLFLVPLASLRNSFGFKVKLGQVTFSLEKVPLGASTCLKGHGKP